MIIKLSPQRSDKTIVVEKYNDTLVINGVEYDFSPLLEGYVLPFGSVDCEFIVGDVVRKNGNVVLTLILPYNNSHSVKRRFPKDLENIPDGLVELPE